MTEILPGLWLGNIENASSLHFVKNNNIEIIINVSKDIPNYFENYITYFRIPVDDPGPGREDENTEIMNSILPYISCVIKNFRQGKKRYNILVHCHAGAQRSPTIIAAYILRFCTIFIPGFGYISDLKNTPIYIKEKKLDAVISHLVKLRPIVFFGGRCVNFKTSLLKYISEI
ncbi:MAG: dual specificity protein phosphatase family protein [Nitrososphaerota archaeon]